MAKERYPKLEMARRLVEAGEPDEAWDLVKEFLNDDPNHVPAMILATSILDKAHRWPEAYQFARRAVELAPTISYVWTNAGRLSEEMYLLTDAEFAYKKAVELSIKPSQKALNLGNLASFYNTTANWDWADKTARDCLAIDPQCRHGLGNLGVAQLARGQWKEGWLNYEAILGSDQRKLVKYRNEPDWDGTPGKDVVIYGEQGLGDELSFASMVPDAIKVCKKVILDCDKRLLPLFKRSFPQAKCYGNRWNKTVVVDAGDDKPDYSISIGQLGKHFRHQDSDFPGTPYLKADPERVLMWREYFKTKNKPVIGIAWSGGLLWTAARFRKWALAELQPLFNAVDAHWVCLQYKDAEDEIQGFKGADIHQYKFATLSKDYDDTASLVASCDLVISMQTSVAHLSAALGIEAWTFVNQFAQWRYGRDFVPWYQAMKVFRQVDGVWPIEEAAKLLKLRYGTLALKRA